MGVLQAVKQGLGLVKRLWVAGAAYLLLFSAMGMWVTLVLPYEVVDGQVRVPQVQNAEDLIRRLLPALGIYLLTFGGALYVFAGVLGNLGLLLRGRPVSAADFIVAANRRALSLLGWGAAFFGLGLAAGIGAAFLCSFLWAILGQPPLLKPLIQMGGSFAFMGVGLAFTFSPFALVERGGGLRAVFLEAWRFFRGHAQATIRLFLAISVLGAAAWLLGLFILAPAVAGLRALLGIAPFSPGLPVFFFSLILGIPQAFVMVFIPSVLYSYYYGNSAQ